MAAPLYNFYELPSSNPLNLPRLPVPKLEDTIASWLQTVEAVLSPEEMSRARKLAEDFLKGEGPALHQKVVDLSKGSGYPYSYIEKFWDDMYLAPNDCCPIWCNPGFLEVPWSKLKCSQAGMAARYVVSQMKFWKKVKDGQLEVLDKNPQCIKAFYAFYGTARIPQAAPNRDILSFNPESRHIVILRANKIFSLEVIGADGECVSVEDLEKELQRLIDANPAAPKEPQVSMLTAADRGFWAKHWHTLMTDYVNQRALKTMDSALFSLCLDATPGGEDLTKVSEALLHNFGYDRWFDKTLNWIIFPDGHAGINFEHSWADGMVWNRMLREVWHDAQGINAPGCTALPTLKAMALKPATPVVFNVPASVAAGIKEAAKEFQDFCQNTHTKVLDFQEFGGDKIKAMKVSPDAFVQMAIQLAQHRLHNNFVSTYESCAVGKFFHGRTETIRSCSMEAKAFVQSMVDSKATAGERKEKLNKAAARQTEISKACAGGLGVDRHLRAMKEIAAASGNLPAFYKDPIYPLTSTWRLSTSNVSTIHNRLFCFGPVCMDGYGLGYVIFPGFVSCNITCFRSDPTKSHNSDKMAEALAQALKDMATLMSS